MENVQPPLVGRDPELDELESDLAELLGGRGSCVAITGEPGIGKSRMAAELVRRASDRGAAVLQARGSDLERDVPFGIFVDALGDRVAELHDSGLERLLPATLADLAGVFPALSGHRSADEPTLQSERWRLHRAVRELLEELARDAPVVLVLDDVHWADEASVELIAHLVHRPPEAAVFTLLLYRPRAVAHTIASTVTRGQRDGRVHEVVLGTLNETDAGQLLGAAVPPAELRALHRDSGGNPLYLLELARAHTTGTGRVADALRASTGEEVPSGVVWAIADEMRSLGDDAGRLARGAAVVGDPFDLWLAAEVAELPEDRAFAAADDVLARDVVRRSDVPGRFAFRHPIVHQAVYESAGDAWRLGAHARAAEALAARGGSLPARAHHVDRSSVDDEAAALVLEAAGDEVASRMPAGAARWYGAALRRLPVESPPEQRLGLLLALAMSLMAAGRVVESLGALEEALRVVPRSQAETRASVLGFIAGLEHMRGHHQAAREQLLSALATGAGSDAATAALELELAVGHWLAGDPDELVQLAERVAARLSELNTPGMRAEAVALLAVGEADRRMTAVAMERRSEAEVLIKELSERDLARHVRAILLLGHADLRLERFASSVSWLERGVRYARRTGQDFWFVALTTGAAYPAAWLGRLDEAARHAELGHKAALTLANDQALVWSTAACCWTALLRGELETALEYGEELVATVERAPASVFAWSAGCFLGAVLIASGDVERGVRSILHGGGDAELSRVDPPMRTWWFVELAEAELARGDPGAAEDWVRRAETAAAALGQAGREGWALRARAGLMLARGDAAQAAETADRATELLNSVDQRLDAARAEVLAGRALAEVGRKDAAVQRLEHARTVLAGCGARAYTEEAANALRQLGRRPRTTPGTALEQGVLDAISARELEVARLAAEGLSNRQIAETLFLSVKTVESHLTRVFAKLGVSSRTSLAREMARLDTAPERRVSA